MYIMNDHESVYELVLYPDDIEDLLNGTELRIDVDGAFIENDPTFAIRMKE